MNERLKTIKEAYAKWRRYGSWREFINSTQFGNWDLEMILEMYLDPEVFTDTPLPADPPNLLQEVVLKIHELKEINPELKPTGIDIVTPAKGDLTYFEVRIKFKK